MDHISIRPLHHISLLLLSRCLYWSLLSEKKTGIEQATFEVVKRFKRFFSVWNERENESLRKYLGHEGKIDDLTEVTTFVKSKKEWEQAMESTGINQEHHLFGGDFNIFELACYKIHIIILVKNSKGLIVDTDTDQMNPLLSLWDPLATKHPSCHLYVLSY